MEHVWNVLKGKKLFGPTIYDLDFKIFKDMLITFSCVKFNLESENKVDELLISKMPDILQNLDKSLQPKQKTFYKENLLDLLENGKWFYKLKENL